MGDTGAGERLTAIMTGVIARLRDEDAAPGDVLADLVELRSIADTTLPPDKRDSVLRRADHLLVEHLGVVGPHRLTNQLLVDPEPPTLTERFGEAVVYAAELHHDQRRTATRIPYVAHLLGATGFLLEQPGVDEDQAIATLLHDAIEDQPDRTDAAAITERFGPEVTRIVLDCTDAHTHPKPPWRLRKVAYLAHLDRVGRSSLQVSLADKLHNARAIVTDLETEGPAVWGRFKAPPVAQHWYYTTLAELFSRRLGNALAQALQRSVERLTAHLPHEVSLDEEIERPPWVGTTSVTGSAEDLTGAAYIIGVHGEEMVQRGDRAWTSPDGRWWAEETWNGDQDRPLTVFVAPAPGG